MNGIEPDGAVVGSLVVERVVAVEYHRPTDNGRTSPSIIICEQSDGFLVEVVAKFSDRCTIQGLAFELLAACLAADLGLPVPEPFVVEVDNDWTATITNEEIRKLIAASTPVAFGSKHHAEGYQGWNPGAVITEMMSSTAAGIFLFDGIIQNNDRRSTNANCKVTRPIDVLNLPRTLTVADLVGENPHSKDEQPQFITMYRELKELSEPEDKTSKQRFQDQQHKWSR